MKQMWNKISIYNYILNSNQVAPESRQVFLDAPKPWIRLPRCLPSSFSGWVARRGRWSAIRGTATGIAGEDLPGSCGLPSRKDPIGWIHLAPFRSSTRSDGRTRNTDRRPWRRAFPLPCPGSPGIARPYGKVRRPIRGGKSTSHPRIAGAPEGWGGRGRESRPGSRRPDRPAIGWLNRGASSIAEAAACVGQRVGNPAAGQDSA